MYTHIVLIANRRSPMDDRHYIKCESKERAKTVARNYDTPDHKFNVSIYALGDEIDIYE